MMYESDDKVEKIGEHSRVDHCWRSIFKRKTLTGERKYPMLEKLIKSVLSLHHANGAVERSLSSNNNAVQTERNKMLEENHCKLRKTERTCMKQRGSKKCGDI